MPKNYFFSKAEIENSLKECRSVSAAARYLGVDYRTMKKFAELYGLFEEYKNQSGKGISKWRDGYIDLQSILKGRITIENKYYLKRLLIRECILEEKCNRCGFKDKRILSYSVPLVLDFIDGNQENQYFYNLRLLCPNCYFLEKAEKKVSRILREYEEQIQSVVV